MNQKGFIGSIGDDLPSLVPLFFAIMLFFSSLAYTFTSINERNDYLNTYIDSLKLAKTALGKGSFSTHEEFVETMQKIITTSNFVTGLIYVEPRGEEIGLSGELGIDTSPLDPDDFICELEDGGIRLRETPATISISYEGVVDAQNYSPCKTDGEFVYLSSGIREKFYGNQLNLLELSRTRDVFVYSYPISLYTPRGAIPVFLLVVVW